LKTHERYHSPISSTETILAVWYRRAFVSLILHVVTELRVALKLKLASPAG
jgi:hypothetical protein